MTDSFAREGAPEAALADNGGPWNLPSGRLCLLAPGEGEPAGRLLSELDPWKTLGYPPARLAAYLGRPDPALRRFVLKVSDTAAGVMCLRHPWLLGPYLEIMAVYLPFQGRGLGRELLTWLTTCNPAWHNLWTCVSSFNHQARGFYQAFGFKEVGRLVDLVRPGYDELLLRKLLRLSPSDPQ